MLPECFQVSGPNGLLTEQSGSRICGLISKWLLDSLDSVSGLEGLAVWKTYNSELSAKVRKNPVWREHIAQEGNEVLSC